MFTYCSLASSDYLPIFYVLMHNRIPFEWHSKLRCGRCYLDFTLDNEHNPSLCEILDEVDKVALERGKKLEMRIYSTYEY